MASPSYIRGLNAKGHSWCARGRHWFSGSARNDGSCYEHLRRPPATLAADAGGVVRSMSRRPASLDRRNRRLRAMRILASRYPDEFEQLLEEVS